MRIGIDAKWYVSGNPSGKVVVKNIVNELVDFNTSHEFVFFLQKKDRNKSGELEAKCKSKPNVKIVYCLSALNFVSNLFIVPFYARKYKVDICLYQNFTPFFFHKKIKNIVYIHDFLFLDYPEYYSLVERMIFRLMPLTTCFANRIITISENERKRIAKHTKFAESEIDVVYHGVSDDFTEENSVREIPISLPDKYILFLGRINVRKNIQILLSALPDISKEYCLVIVGKKDHKTFDINTYIERMELVDRVKLLGHVSYQDLLVILSKAKIFVFPSFAEGFGLPPLEAMKSGVPVIVSNATCLPEVCQGAALYFDPNNKTELAEKVNVLDQKEIYLDMKKRGLEHVKKFRWQIAACKIMDIFERI